MKIRSILAASLMTAAMISFSALSANAQEKACCPSQGKAAQCQPAGEHQCPMSMLTDEQKKQIEPQKTALMKERLTLKNQIAEKKAHLRTLSMMDEPNLADINKTIDEIYAMKADMAKKKEAMTQTIRKMLTPEQRMKFDMQRAKGDDDDDNCKGMGQGCQHPGMMQGQGCQQHGMMNGQGCQQHGMAPAGQGCQQHGMQQGQTPGQNCPSKTTK